MPQSEGGEAVNHNRVILSKYKQFPAVATRPLANLEGHSGKSKKYFHMAQSQRTHEAQNTKYEEGQQEER